MNCCICGKDAGKYGHSAQPVMKGQCCDECNMNKVVPARLKRAPTKVVTLKDYVKRERKQKWSDKKIAETLFYLGYSDKEIEEAM